MKSKNQPSTLLGSGGSNPRDVEAPDARRFRSQLRSLLRKHMRTGGRFKAARLQAALALTER